MNVENDRDKPRANMTAWDYFLQTCFSEFQKVYPMQEVSDYNFQKAAKNRWEEMTDREKKIFYMRADRDKLRYDNEMVTYVPMSSDGGTEAVKRKEERDMPRKNKTAFEFFVHFCRSERKKQYPDEDVSSDFDNKCAERWVEMSDREKKIFCAIAARDKLRYDKEITTYVPMSGDEGRRAVKRTKGRDVPIRPPSAFFLFCGYRRGEVMKANPAFEVGDIANTLARMWSECPPDEKVKYDVLAKSAEEKYAAQVDGNKDKQQRELSGAKKPRKEPSSSSGSDSSDGDGD